MPLNLNTLTSIVHRHWDGSQLQAFVKWWLAELTGTLPMRWQPHRKIKSVRWPLPQDLAADPGAVNLLLAPDQVLRQTVYIPRAALRNTAEMLRYEIDKFSPLDAADIHYTWRATSTQDPQAAIDLLIIRRTQLQDILDACALRGFKVIAIDVLDQAGMAQGVDLLPRQHHQTDAAQGKDSIINATLLGLCVMLTVTTMMLWLHARSVQLEAAQSGVNTLHARVTALDSTYQKAKAHEDARAWSLQQKNNHPALSVKLAQISECMPKDSWLSHLEVDQANRVSISGHSANPEQLLTRMQHCKGVAVPQFRGVIQADKNTGTSRFTLALQLTGTEP